MKKQTYLISDEGKVLTNGEIYGKVIPLEENETENNFHEITEEEYKKIYEKEETT